MTRIIRMKNDDFLTFASVRAIRGQYLVISGFMKKNRDARYAAVRGFTWRM
jgi:hypothetical protein